MKYFAVYDSVSRMVLRAGRCHDNLVGAQASSENEIAVELTERVNANDLIVTDDNTVERKPL